VPPESRGSAAISRAGAGTASPGRLAACAAALIAAATLAHPALAGVVHGRLITQPAREALRAVVYVDSLPPKVEEKLAKPHWWAPHRPPRVIEGHNGFTPAVVAVPVGSPLLIQNLDRVFHAPFGVSQAGTVHLTPQAPGTINTVTLDHPGVFNLFCALHSNEFGTVMVVPNHAFARPDSLGRFTLPKLPPGNYRLRVWHPQLGTSTREITLPLRGDINVELSQ
jgi:plastocyanin